MESRLIDFSKYRFQTAEDDLEAAKMLFDMGKWKAALNRSYYAIFHALRAVIALDGFDAKKHSAVISYFNCHYVKTGVFEQNVSKLITSAFELRGNADYQDFYVVSKEDVQTQIGNADRIIGMVKAYLDVQYNGSTERRMIENGNLPQSR